MARTRPNLVLALLAASWVWAGRADAAGTECQQLASLTLPNAKITTADLVRAGQFVPPAAAGAAVASPAANPFADVPAFCRVVATLTPTSDSDIRVEVWLPSAGWNGKFQAVGNGGYTGTIPYPALALAVRAGYAAAATDTGHAGGSAEFALGHPEKLADFAGRAVHEMTDKAKAIVRAHYDSAPRLSYWVGCSAGGKQGLKEAASYPADYDAIIAGAPANNWSGLMVSMMTQARATLLDPATSLPASKLALLHGAVMNACDARDGVKDGLLENPNLCSFDPGTLQCAGEDAASCLTAAQGVAARKIYGAVTHPATGRRIFPGMSPGGELNWGALAGGPQPSPLTTDFFKFIVYGNPAWDWKAFDLANDADAGEKAGAEINATATNLRSFLDRGGKLILYHGWNDQLIAPMATVDHYNAIVSAVGPSKASGGVRLFMVPGMNHCTGGDGPNTFDMASSLDEWRDKGVAPARVVASHAANGVVDRTRPLCPYPQVAAYTGAGSSDDAANFACR